MNVCKAISCKAVLFDVTLYNLTKYRVRPTHLTSRWTTLLNSMPFHVRYLAIPYYPESIVIMLCHFMYDYTMPILSLTWPLLIILYYVPVKSKLQHPSPGNPRAFEFLENYCSNSPSPGQKTVQMPPPSGKLPDYCFNFSEASNMLLKLCMCKHGLLDNTLTITCHKIMGIFHINTSSSNIVDELTITSWVVAKIIFNINWIHWRFYVFSCNNHSIYSFHHLYTYICIAAKYMKSYHTTLVLHWIIVYIVNTMEHI